MEKISIIVPVYKVEQYLRQCIESLLNQTYTNLEIILVDDGSPDKCGDICDEYSKKDNRIKVIHKPNGGLSDARNAGIHAVTGKYIGFIDSDDYIEEDMYEVLYNLILKNGSDISMCSFYKEINNKTEKEKFTNMEKNFNKTDALKHLLLNKKICSHAWNKLYKKELFEDVLYPVGKCYEDIGTMFYLFDKVEKVSFKDTPKYHYRIKREGSIIAQATKTNMSDFIDMADKRFVYLNSNSQIAEYNYFAKVNNIIKIHYSAIINNMKDFYFGDKLLNEYNKVKKIIKEKKVEINKFYTIKWRLYIFIFILNRKLTWNIIYFFVRRRK